MITTTHKIKPNTTLFSRMAVLLFFVVCLTSNCFSQEVIPFSRILDSLKVETDSEFVLSDKIIRNDIKGSEKWLIENYRKIIEEDNDTLYYQWKFPDNIPFICNRPFKVQNCEFEDEKSLFFPKIEFRKPVTIIKSFNKLTCIVFSKCTFKGDTEFIGVKNMLLYSCKFTNDLFMELPEKAGLNIINCFFSPSFNINDDFKDLYLSFLSLRGQDVDFIQIVKSNFKKSNFDGLIDFENLSTQNFYFIKNTVEAKVFMQRTFFWGVLNISDNVFKSNFIVNSSKFPTDNFYFPFDQIRNNISVSKETGEAIVLKDTIVTINDIENHDDFFTNKMSDLLSRLGTSYKSSGDKTSYDKVFLIGKGIEVQTFKNTLKTNFSFTNLILYLLNALIAWYSDFGTNLTKAFINTFIIIFIFSCIYFIEYLLFKNKIDYSERKNYLILKQNLEYLSKTISKFISRFKKNKSFGKLFIFIDIKLPLIFNQFSKLFSIIKYLVSILFHSILLSTNAFFTLGFGELSIIGKAKYFKYAYVLEGLIGWFLLTFLVVSLVAKTIG